MRNVGCRSEISTFLPVLAQGENCSKATGQKSHDGKHGGVYDDVDDSAADADDGHDNQGGRDSRGEASMTVMFDLIFGLEKMMVQMTKLMTMTMTMTVTMMRVMSTMAMAVAVWVLI